MARECVVDASVVVKLFRDEEFSDLASRLFAVLTTDREARYYAPELVYVECAQELTTEVRGSGTSANVRQATERIHRLQALGLRRVRFSVRLFRQAIDLILEYRVHSPDAIYAALALSMGLPLVTEDKKAIRALQGSRVDTRRLLDLTDDWFA